MPNGRAPGGTMGGLVNVPRLPDPAVVRPVVPSSATKEKPYVNDLGMKFVPVVSYKSGKKVLFSVWETRRQDYAAYASSVSEVDSEWKAQEFEGEPVGQGADHPVVSVSWDDATAYCQWLTKRERAAGRIGAGDEYRLPTDMEWSYAVGIGEKEDASASPKDKDGKLADLYPWGSGFPPPANSGNYADSIAKAKFTDWTVIEGYRDGHATTAPVGSYECNRYGLHDLGGNVYEWCQDWYDGEQKYRVLRGGSWDVNGRVRLRSACRVSGDPRSRDGYTGFRCVLVVAGG